MINQHDSLANTKLLRHFSHNIHGLHPRLPRVPLPAADAQHIRALHHPAGDGVSDRRSRRVPPLAPGQVSRSFLSIESRISCVTFHLMMIISLQVFTAFSHLFLVLNSSINILIYSLLSSRFRDEVVKRVRRTRWCSNSSA